MEQKNSKTKKGLGERCIKHAGGSQFGGTLRGLESTSYGVQKAKSAFVNGNRTAEMSEWMGQWH